MSYFVQLERAYLTSVYFPDHPTMVACNHCHSTQSDDSLDFFSSEKNPQQCQASVFYLKNKANFTIVIIIVLFRCFAPYCVPLLQLARKFKKLKLTEFKFCALSGIVLWNDGKNFIFVKFILNKKYIFTVQLYSPFRL